MSSMYDKTKISVVTTMQNYVLILFLYINNYAVVIRLKGIWKINEKYLFENRNHYNIEYF